MIWSVLPTAGEALSAHVLVGIVCVVLAERTSCAPAVELGTLTYPQLVFPDSLLPAPPIGGVLLVEPIAVDLAGNRSPPQLVPPF